MKTLKSLVVFLFFPLTFFSQSLNGIWIGVLSNDSTTVRKDQSFELALTEYRGKVYGYAYSTFIVRDTLYYIVKRVKGKINGDICEVEDDEVVSHNFQRKPEKGVFVTYTLKRNDDDSTWYLDGTWTTNTTKRYYTITGGVKTKEERDFSRSKLFEHLGDLNLQNKVALANPERERELRTEQWVKQRNIDITKEKVIEEDRSDIAMESGVTGKNADLKVPVIQSVVSNTETTTDPVTKTGSGPVNEKDLNNTIAKTNTNTDEKKLNTETSQKIQTSPVAPDPVQPDKNKVIINPGQQNRQTDVAKNPQQANSYEVNDPNKKQLVTVPPGTNINQQNQQTDVAKNQTQVNDNAVNDPNKKQLVSVPPGTYSNQQNQQQVNSNAVNDPNKKQLVSVPPGIYSNQQNQQQVNNNAVNDPNKKQLVSVPPGTINNQQNHQADVAKNQLPQAEYQFREPGRAEMKMRSTQMVSGRESAPSETIFFAADSLVLSLYDNGEVDGDTVSVILDEEVIISKQGLKSSAYRQTIYLAPGESDSILLVLYAENLGKYPPNTGLLTIKDGDDLYYVRFKADYDRNAAIMLKRKKAK